MTKLLQKAFDEASKLPEVEQDALGRVLLEELASERRWKTFLPGHTIYSLTLLTRHWRNTVRGEPRSLIRTNCDLAYHCAVPKNVRRTACRGSTSSASSISNL